jgi:hypothetical protein
MLRKFPSGEIFVSPTLAGLNSLGVILIIWPFLWADADYFSDLMLRAWGDLPDYAPLGSNVDLGAAVMGVVLLAFEHMIEHAIDIKPDQALTT